MLIIKTFISCIIVKILNPMRLIQKTYLFSVQIEIPLENTLKSVGYTDTVLFLTIGKSDIY
jgi:hypothetical protein